MRSIKFAMTLSEFYSSYTTIKKIRFYDTINWRVYDSYPERTEQSETPSWETITAFTDTKSSSEWTGFSVSAKEASSISLLRRVNNYNGKFVGVMELVIDEARLTVCTGTLNLRIWNFLVDAGGRIVSSSDKARLGENLGDKNYYEFITTHTNEGQIFKIGEMPYLVISKEYERWAAGWWE